MSVKPLSKNALRVLKYFCSLDERDVTPPWLVVASVAEQMVAARIYPENTITLRNRISTSCKELADGAYLERRSPVSRFIKYRLSSNGYRFGQAQGWILHDQLPAKDPEASEPEPASEPAPAPAVADDPEQKTEEEVTEPATNGYTPEDVREQLAAMGSIAERPELDDPGLAIEVLDHLSDLTAAGISAELIKIREFVQRCHE